VYCSLTWLSSRCRHDQDHFTRLRSTADSPSVVARPLGDVSTRRFGALCRLTNGGAGASNTDTAVSNTLAVFMSGLAPGQASGDRDTPSFDRLTYW
jgi:hypothetical protein